MKIFLDTADLKQIEELKHLADGVTTNPIICVKSGVTDLEKHMKQILTIMDDKPVSIEVTSNDPEEMLEQAREFARWGSNAVVKLPCNEQGLKATALLSKEGTKINVTACMNSNQAILASRARATYTSLFWGRIEDMGYDASQVVRETRDIFDRHNICSEIIIGSLRQVSDFTRASKTGAHILTVPPDLLRKCIRHPRTDTTIAEFLAEWQKLNPT